MNKTFILQPSEVWSYYTDHMVGLDTIFEIASNKEYGTVIYLTNDWDAYPTVVVEADGYEVCDYLITEVDAEETVQRLYDTYLTDKAIDALSDLKEDVCNFESNPHKENDMDPIATEEIIDARENELDMLVKDFVSGVTNNDADIYEDNDIIEDLKEHFLEYMYKIHGIKIFRPMMLEDENGEDFYADYPYEHMIFD